MIKNKNIFITGNSSGLGLSLTNKLVSDNKIFSVSRSKIITLHKNIKHYIVNFEDLKKLEKTLRNFNFLKTIDYLILNAGVLGSIKFANNININELIAGFKINVLSNKIIIDYFLNKKTKIKNIIAISSGAALSAKDGWLNYCGSKSYLKMLIETYSIENPKINMINLSPGLIKTKMQKQIFETKNKKIISIVKFKSLYKNNLIKKPGEIADNVINFLENISKFKKVKYIDLRKI